MISRESTAAASDACPMCGGRWAPVSMMDGRVLVVCDACGVHEMVIAHAPVPEHKAERRSVSSLTVNEVRAIAKRIEDGSTIDGEARAFGTTVNARMEFSAVLREVLGDARYTEMVDRVHRRVYPSAGRHNGPTARRSS